MRRPAAWIGHCVVAWILCSTAAAADPTMRIGLLRYGTVSWSVDVVREHGLDRAEGFELKAVEVASTSATLVALQAGGVDVVVSDWLWVSRQRAAGADWTFFPFSTAVGALVVPSASPIHMLGDLRHRRLGIAGSPVDKSWTILRALAKRRAGLDLDRETEKSFAAPPLLNEELLAGRLDAVLTYWPFAARLEAHGMRPVLSVSDALRELGFEAPVPLVGYVVSEAWVSAHKAVLSGFVRASLRAQKILASSDEEWERLAPRTGARDASELAALRDTYRSGIPTHWGATERRDAARLYGLFAGVGGPALVGTRATLQPGTFLDDVQY